MQLIKSSKFKRIAAVIAAVFVMCLTCLTAFADENPTVDYGTPGTYTLEFSGGNNSNPGVVVSTGTASAGYTYTVTFTSQNANKFQGTGAIQISEDNGTTWETVASVEGSTIIESAIITYTAEDDVAIRIQAPRIGVYEPYTVTVVVSAPAPFADVLAATGSFVGTFTNTGTSIVSFLMDTPLALLGVIAWLVILVCAIFGRFVKQ